MKLWEHDSNRVLLLMMLAVGQAENNPNTRQDERDKNPHFLTKTKKLDLQ